jgi:hypothetical protein
MTFKNKSGAGKKTGIRVNIYFKNSVFPTLIKILELKYVKRLFLLQPLN